MWWWLACTPVDDDAVDLPLLDVDVAERARLADTSTAFTVDPVGGPGLLLSNLGGRPVPVVDPGEDGAVRVRIHTHEATLLLWLPTEALHDVTRQATWGAARNPGQEGLPGVRFDAGLPVERGLSTHGATRVALDDGALHVEAWVHDADLDHVYRVDDAVGREPEDPFAEPDAAPGTPVQLLGGSVLTDERGRTLAWLGGTEEDTYPPRTSARLLEEGPGWAHVAVEGHGLLVDGFVVPEAIANGLWGWGMSCGGCCAGAWGLGAGPTIPAGTPLRAVAGGPIIGRARLDLAATQVGEALTATVWGTDESALEVWADPGDAPYEPLDATIVDGGMMTRCLSDPWSHD